MTWKFDHRCQAMPCHFSWKFGLHKHSNNTDQREVHEVFCLLYHPYWGWICVCPVVSGCCWKKHRYEYYFVPHSQV